MTGQALALAGALAFTAAGGTARAADACFGATKPVIDLHLHAYEKDPRWDRRVPSPSEGGGGDLPGAQRRPSRMSRSV